MVEDESSPPSVPPVSPIEVGEDAAVSGGGGQKPKKRRRIRVRRTWEESMDLLLGFKAKFGHCNVPWKFADDPQLARWVNKQKAEYPRFKRTPHISYLNEERLSLLKSVGAFDDWKLRDGDAPDDESTEATAAGGATAATADSLVAAERDEDSSNRRENDSEALMNLASLAGGHGATGREGAAEGVSSNQPASSARSAGSAAPTASALAHDAMELSAAGDASQAKGPAAQPEGSTHTHQQMKKLKADFAERAAQSLIPLLEQAKSAQALNFGPRHDQKIRELWQVLEKHSPRLAQVRLQQRQEAAARTDMHARMESSIEGLARNFSQQVPFPASTAGLPTLDVSGAMGAASSVMNYRMNPPVSAMSLTPRSPTTPMDAAAGAGHQPEISEFDKLVAEDYFGDLTHDPVVQHVGARQHAPNPNQPM